MADTIHLGIDEATRLCERAALAAGANQEAAASLAKSVVAAEAKGLTVVGLSHLLDYLDALRAGRIDGNAEPVITRPALTLYMSDAKGGLAHTGFDRVCDAVAKTARLFGVAIFTQKNAYTCG
jgi:(2R)-3-sulfolactate dehydrogenase (NADP+)